MGLRKKAVGLCSGHWTHRVAATCLLTGALLCACTSRDHDRAAITEPGIRKEFARGPVTVIVNTDRSEISVAETLSLRIAVIADETYDADLPDLGETLDRFKIADVQTGQPELLDAGRIRASRIYDLEPFLPGEYRIPPITITFRRKNEPQSAVQELETGAFTIRVTSLLPDDAEDRAINEIKPPVELAARPWLWAGIAVGCALLIGSAAGLLWFARRRRTQAVDERVTPPHELAFDDLRKLADENLIENGQVKRFYQRISDILRRYIERRFGLHAPEQTTEEFLDCLRSSNDLDAKYRSLLEAFLRHCDLVKFAEYQPSNQEIEQTFDSCRAFVAGTTETNGDAGDSPPQPVGDRRPPVQKQTGMDD